MRRTLSGAICLLTAWAFLGCSSSSRHSSNGAAPGTTPTSQSTALATATPGEPYAAQLIAPATSGSSTWIVVSGALPAGIVLSSDGVLSGTPTAAAVTATFDAQATSTSGSSVVAFTIVVNATSSITTANPLPIGFVGQNYDQAFSSSGTEPGTWALPGGANSLPPGLTLSTTGVLSGTPSSTGVFTFAVSEQDPPTNGIDGPTSVRNFSLTIEAAGTPAALTITTPNPLTAATFNVGYSASFQTNGGVSPVTWALAFGSGLPAGLSLSSSGFLSGTPTVRGSFSFQVQATDSSTPTRETSVGTYQLTVN